MDFNRDWTTFALDAEIEHFGESAYGRITAAHNAIRARVTELEAQLADLREKAAWYAECAEFVSSEEINRGYVTAKTNQDGFSHLLRIWRQALRDLRAAIGEG